jgi:hypothetical protein
MFDVAAPPVEAVVGASIGIPGHGLGYVLAAYG